MPRNGILRGSRLDRREEVERRAIGLMREEVNRDMALAGVRSIGEMTSELVRRVGV